MSASPSSTARNTDQEISPRISLDSSLNLNDDLAADAVSEISSSSVSVISTIHPSHPHSAAAAAIGSAAGVPKRRSGSVVSFRNSIDADSSFSSSAYFFTSSPHNLRQQVQTQQATGTRQVSNQMAATQQSMDSLSPLGPNSIYKLTVGSDISRKQKNRAPKTHITINGGLTTVYNINAPTVSAIPQIQLSPLKSRVSNDELKKKYIENGREAEYKRFDSQESKLTEGTLQKLQQQQEATIGLGLTNEGTEIDVGPGGGRGRSATISSIVPTIFSDPSFRLDDPRTFKKVIENSTILASDNEQPVDYLVNNTQLQEKLSHYLDLVEISLVEEISKSSNSFFNTIDEIQDIEVQSGLCMDQFDKIIERLEGIETDECMRGLDILNKIKLRKNVDRLESALIQVQEILGQYEECQKLYDAGNFTTCLEMIVELEILITERSEFSLSRLPGLFDLQNDLHKLKLSCTSEYIKEFVGELIKDLHSHFQSVPEQETLSRMSGAKRGASFGYQKVSDETKDVLREYVLNLANSGMLSQAYGAYQERIINEVKDIIKVNLPRKDVSNTPSRSGSVPPPTEQPSKTSPEPAASGPTLMVPNSSSSGGSNAANGGTLSNNLKSMSSTEFLLMLTRTFTNLSECLRRLTTHQKLLLDLALTSIPPSDNIDVMTFDITLAINKAIEITQVRLAKVINVRSELIADLPVDQYMRVYSISSAYLQECELINPGFITSEGGNSLNDWVRNHINYFIHRFHSNSLKALIQECDKEIWKEVTNEETLRSCQAIVNELVTYSEFIETQGKSGYSGEQWLESMNLQKDMEEIQKSKAAITAMVNISPESKVRIGEHQFLVPGLVLKVLTSAKDYIILSKVFSSRSSTLENDLLNYFKLLNSRTSQAILGAGATRTAGLKHIFPKHMALCIQLIGFIIDLLEKVQVVYGGGSHTTGNGNSKDANSSNGHEGGPSIDEINFTRIISNYKDHENEIFGKLISMMYERTVNHCNTIKTIDWSEPIKHPHQCHQYMETLVKDTTTITKVLLKYLPEIQCQLILSQVFDNYKKLFVECYCTQLPQFKDFNEKHSLLKDIDYFRVKLGEIPGYGNSGQVIWENINSMPTIEDTKMEEIMRKNIARERGIPEERKSAEAERKEAPKESDVEEKPEDASVVASANSKEKDEIKVSKERTEPELETGEIESNTNIDVENGNLGGEKSGTDPKIQLAPSPSADEASENVAKPSEVTEDDVIEVKVTPAVAEASVPAKIPTIESSEVLFELPEEPQFETKELVEDSKDVSKDSIEEPKEGTKGEPKAEKIEAANEAPVEGAKNEEPNEENEAASKEKPEIKAVPHEKATEESKQSEEVAKEVAQEVEPKDVHQEAEEEPKRLSPEAEEELKEEPKEVLKVVSSEAEEEPKVVSPEPKEEPKEELKDTPQEEPIEEPKEKPKEELKEEPIEEPKEEPKEESKDTTVEEIKVELEGTIVESAESKQAETAESAVEATDGTTEPSSETTEESKEETKKPLSKSQKKNQRKKNQKKNQKKN